MTKYIKKADIILIAAMIIIGVWFSAALVFGKSEGQALKVTVAGKVYGTYDTGTDTVIDIESGTDKNTFEIKNGAVSMISSNCKGYDCVHEHSISRQGETIVCLPHKVVLEITGEEKEVDAIVR